MSSFKKSTTAKPGDLIMQKRAEEKSESASERKKEAKIPGAEGKESAHKPAPKTFKGKSMALGGGGRFAKGVASLEAKGKSKESAGAIMAAAGRAKYGAKKMAAMSAAGKK